MAAYQPFARIGTHQSRRHSQLKRYKPRVRVARSLSLALTRSKRSNKTTAPGEFGRSCRLREKELHRLATYESEFKAWLIRKGIPPENRNWDSSSYPLWWFWNHFSDELLAEERDREHLAVAQVSAFVVVRGCWNPQCGHRVALSLTSPLHSGQRFLAIFSRIRSYRVTYSKATGKNELTGSLKSPACSCVSITLPAAS